MLWCIIPYRDWKKILKSLTEEGFFSLYEAVSRCVMCLEETQTIINEPEKTLLFWRQITGSYSTFGLKVNGGALEQLGSNVSITGSVETLRVDIIESEASKLNRKKRKTGLHQGNTVASSSGDTNGDSNTGRWWRGIYGDPDLGS